MAYFSFLQHRHIIFALFGVVLLYIFISNRTVTESQPSRPVYDVGSTDAVLSVVAEIEVPALLETIGKEEQEKEEEEEAEAKPKTTPEPTEDEFKEKKFDVDKDANYTEVYSNNTVDPSQEIPRDLRPTSAYITGKGSMMRIVDKYKIATCLVPKTMTTVLGGILCNLFNSSYNEGFVTEPCEKNLVTDLNHFHQHYDKELDDWTIIFSIRHPIDRFLSAFVHVCVGLKEDCYGCGTNMTCFIENLPAGLDRYAKSSITYPSNTDHHFMPQTWHCDFFKLMSHIKYLRYTSDYEKEVYPRLEELLQEAKVPQYRIDVNMDKIKSVRTGHTTRYSPATVFFKKRLFESARLVHILNQVYFHDYAFFNYNKAKLGLEESIE